MKVEKWNFLKLLLDWGTGYAWRYDGTLTNTRELYKMPSTASKYQNKFTEYYELTICITCIYMLGLMYNHIYESGSDDDFINV